MKSYFERLDDYINQYLKKQKENVSPNLKILKGLNLEEQLIIENHIDGATVFVNKLLRGEEGRNDDERTKEYYYLLGKVLENVDDIENANLDQILYSGFSLPEEKYLNKIKKSAIYSNELFMSSALEFQVAYWFMKADAKDHLGNTFLYFEIEEHKNSIPIHGGVPRSVDGHEHIFRPNTYFKIIKIDENIGSFEITGNKEPRDKEYPTHIIQYHKILVKEVTKYALCKWKIRVAILNIFYKLKKKLTI